MTDAPMTTPAAVVAEAAEIDAQRRRRHAWITFAGGLESFNVPVVYVLFASYFANRVAPDPVAGQVMWADAAWISGLFSALLAPALAVVGEHPGRRRWLMALLIAVSITAGSALWIAEPGSPRATLTLVLTAYGIAAVSNDLLYVFYGAMLPEVARPAIMGRTSGLGAAIGWVIAIVATAAFLSAFVWPETPLFGLDKEAGEPARLVGPFAGVMMLLFCAPLLLFKTPEPPVRKKISPGAALQRELLSLVRERAAATVVLARFVYWSGVVLVMLFGNVIATSIMGWSETGSSIFGILVLIAGAVGAALGGVVDDKLGTRNALCLILLGLGLSLSLLLSMSPDKAFGVLALEPRAPGAPELSSPAEWIVLALGFVTGTFLGSAGPMGRTLIARYSPPGRTGRYYGLAALAGNATSVIGPYFVSRVTEWTGDQRLGLLVSPVVMLLGVFVLLTLPRQGYRTSDG